MVLEILKGKLYESVIRYDDLRKGISRDEVVDIIVTNYRGCCKEQKA